MLCKWSPRLLSRNSAYSLGLMILLFEYMCGCVSSEEISKICVFFLGGWWGFLLGLLFLDFLFRLFLLDFLLFGNLASRWSTVSESALSLRDELVNRFPLKSWDNLIDFGIRSVRLDTAEKSLQVCGGWVKCDVLISFLPPRVRRAYAAKYFICGCGKLKIILKDNLNIWSPFFLSEIGKVKK